MSKKDIIDYVMETPGNTNKKVLGRLIDEVEGVKLPEVTEDDNGNVLTVVEGAQDKAEPSGGESESYILELVDDNEDPVSILDPEQVNVIIDNINKIKRIDIKHYENIYHAWIQESMPKYGTWIFASNTPQPGMETMLSMRSVHLLIRLSDDSTIEYSIGDSGSIYSPYWEYTDGSWVLQEV